MTHCLLCARRYTLPWLMQHLFQSHGLATRRLVWQMDGDGAIGWIDWTPVAVWTPPR